MRRGDGDEDDPLARRDLAVAVDHSHAEKRPARLRLARRAGDLLLRHAGIMLKLEGPEPSALVAAVADEACDRANVRSSAGERFGLGAGIEILSLDADSRHRRQPPVIGGKKATSFAPAIKASLRA